MSPAAPSVSDEVRLEFTSSTTQPIPEDMAQYARFLLPSVARPKMAEMAMRGPSRRDLPLLTRFAPLYPDPDVHRMILAALARALPASKLPTAFLGLYAQEGPGKARRRGLIREVLSIFDPALLAPLWCHSARDEKLDIVARLRRLSSDALERFMTHLTIGDDSDPVIRCLSLDVWERLDDDGAVRVLLRRLRRRDAKLRAASIEALAEVLERKEALRLLPHCTRDPEPEPRAAAWAALARLGFAEGRDALVAMLSDHDFAVKAAAERYLRSLARPADADPESAGSAARTRRGRTVKMPATAPRRATTGAMPRVRARADETDKIPTVL